MNSLSQFNNLVLSCEHFTNTIPEEYKSLFLNADKILETHRGWDIGANIILKYLENTYGITPWKGEVSRLLVDLNRSIGHKNLYSEFSKVLSRADRIAILDSYYYPYRDSFESEIIGLNPTKKQPIIHISIHSFTPIWKGLPRNADIGILYDTSHLPEKDFSLIWKKEIVSKYPEFKVRSNFPYLGKSNSFPTELRRKYKQKYIGIELEVNQKLFADDGKSVKNAKILHCISETLQNALTIFKA